LPQLFQWFFRVHLIGKKDVHFSTQNIGTMDQQQTFEKAISKDGTGIGFAKRGTGKPILFVHGTSADHKSWIVISPHFEQNLTFYAMDRRGRGESGDAPDYDFMREVEDVVAVVETIGDSVTLFGHSFGGLCCLEAALKTNKIKCLILYEPMVPKEVQKIPSSIIDGIQSRIDKGELESAMELFLREVAKISDGDLDIYRKSPLWKARIPLMPTVPRELAIESSYSFNAEKFAAIKVPVLLLLGEESPEIYRKGAELIDSALPNSKIVTLEGQQHMVHYTNPELLARETYEFLRTVED
jgi:pimeloyl-ACP methyl ester carboxylesterase